MTKEQLIVLSEAAKQISNACLSCLLIIKDVGAIPDEIFDSIKKIAEANQRLLAATANESEVIIEDKCGRYSCQ